MNITLIGLPATGKSTVGGVLAERLGLRFVDTDALMADAAGMALDAFWEQHGVAAFSALEERVVCGLQVEDAVIATGGSVVYSAPAMARLKALGRVVYLALDDAVWQARYNEAAARKVVVPEGMSWEAMVAERQQLYLDYADIVVDCGGAVDDVVKRVLVALRP